MEWHLLCQKVKDPLNGEILILMVQIIMWIKSIQTHVTTTTFQINVFSFTVLIKSKWYDSYPRKDDAKKTISNEKHVA